MKNNTNLKTFMAGLLMLIASLTWAQERPISGVVYSYEDSTPLPGVTVLKKGTSTGTTTDVDGKFTIQASPDDVLKFSFVGYTAEEVNVGDQNFIELHMNYDLQQLQEVVVTGYQTIKKSDLTGAVSVADVESIQQESNVNVLNSMQGRVPGLQVKSDGTPGGGNTAVYIRGFSTINNNGPLYVIDGVPTQGGINTLNPADIESIQVLKDAASASIYGSRASNGVVVITTKQGTKEDLQLSFDSYAGVQMLRNRINVLNAHEWGEIYWQAKRNAGEIPTHPQYGNGENPIMPSWIDADQTIPAANTDWVDEAFNPSLMQYYNLGISNNTEQSNVYFSLSYMDQDGIMEYTQFDRISGRLNTTFNLMDRLTIGENLMITQSNQVNMDDPAFTHQIIFQHPLIPINTVDGGWGGPTDGLGDKRNPIAALYQNKDNGAKTNRLFGNVFAELELLNGLSIKSNFGIDYNSYFRKRFEPRWQEGTRSVNVNYLNVAQSSSTTTVWTNTMNYTLEKELHSLNAIAGVEAIESRFEDLGGRVNGFLVEDQDYQYVNAATADQVKTIFNGGNDYALLSYFAKADYTFMDRYLLSATVRRDGSSRLGANDRTGIFPAVSAGWRISEESFMPENNILSDLKLRAGYGLTGNQEIGNYAGYTVYLLDLENSRYDFAGNNSNPVAGYKLATHGNPDVRWEIAEQLNIGLDASLWQGRLDLTADYFIKKTEDMLVNPPLLGVAGEGAAPFINGGSMENKGLEMLINYKSNPSSEFTYNIGVNFAAINNKVIEIGAGSDFYQGAMANRIVPGQPVSIFYGYVADGLFKSISEIENHADQEGITADEASLGRIRYKDLNKDGVINDEDRTFIGNPHPDFTYGLNLAAQYRNFDFSVFFEGVQGRDIYNVFRQMTDFTYWNFNYGDRVLDAWTPENPDSNIPAVATSNTNNEYRSSSYFVEDGSYLKMKSIVLGYTIPTQLSQRLSISNIRVYLQAQNLFTLTNYGGMDWEVGARDAFSLGVDNQFYPHTRNLTLGLNVTF
ncbi:MAG: SusC/RagA family TonB-linked outer membrane protein [Candidatus Cyclobacteriaceae bacterium M3_2C_046]